MTQSQSLSLSVIAHLLCLSIFIVYQVQLRTPIKYGNADKLIIASYMVNQPITPPHQQQKIERTIPHAIALKKQQQQATKSTITHTRAMTKGEPMPPLVALLHAAIQRTQRYPASAEEMGREGRTTLVFSLHTDGSVSDVKILHSSGTTSLDNAAVAAIHEAAPFQQVNRYIQSTQPYQIDVVFAAG